MLLTEEQAKKAQCIGPENCGRRIGEIAGATHRHCVGSACKMAWRWRPLEEKYLPAAGEPEDEGWELQEKTCTGRWRWVRQRGFCGLAGRPI